MTNDPLPEKFVTGINDSGQSLSVEAKNFYEPRFGYDFSNVKIHTGTLAAKSAQSINARAYTSGDNIVFDQGKYNLQNESGKKLLAHELTHIIQQKHGATHTIQRQPAGKVKAIEPTEEDRKEYEKMQQEYFRQQGEVMAGQILKNAGFKEGQKPTTPDDAVKLITFWGLSMSKIIAEMNSIAASTTTRVSGAQTSSSIALQQKVHFDALSPKGQKAYQKAVDLVKAEAFWKNYFGQNEIYIYPDLGGANRFSGYNQTVNDPGDPTGKRKVIIIHLSKTPLENDFPEMAASTIVHELSHVIYEPNVLQKALSSFSTSVVDLLLEYPSILDERAKAANPAEVKEEQRAKLKQVLYETLAYAEEEIFVHLQQLTHQPDITIKKAGGDESFRGAQVLQAEVLRYIQRLKKIGLDKHMEKGVLDSIGRRVDLFYDRRIAAWPAGSKQRDVLDANKKMAQLLFEMARRGEVL